MFRIVATHRRHAFAGSVILTALLVAGIPAAAGPKTKAGASRCPKRTCFVDVTPPAVTIAAPSANSEVTGSVTVSGTARDDNRVERVDVRFGDSNFVLATGTGTWSTTLDVSAYAEGPYTITARATDAAANASTVSVAVRVVVAPAPEPDPTPPAPEPEPEDPAPSSSDALALEELTLVNPSYSGDLVPLGRGATALDGARSAVLYEERFTHQPWLFVRDETVGSSTHLRLPADSLSGWGQAGYVLRGSDLWILGGGGPLTMRQYRLTGTPLPSTATLVSTESFGDGDSRPGTLIGLAGGGLFGVWHQQGSAGPQGHRYLYRSPGGGWQTITKAFMPTRASKDVAVQHPSDGSIWVFSNPDAWSSIGAAHLTETASGLRVDWVDPYYIAQAQGEFDADQENPDLAVAADSDTGRIVLAYQSAVRRTFSYEPFITGSYPALARISADGSRSFVHLPVYVERVSRLGLTASGGTMWLAYRPIDPGDLTYDDLAIGRYAGGSWVTETVGRMFTANERVVYSPGGAELGARMADGRIHLWLV